MVLFLLAGRLLSPTQPKATDAGNSLGETIERRKYTRMIFQGTLNSKWNCLETSIPTLTTNARVRITIEFVESSTMMRRNMTRLFCHDDEARHITTTLMVTKMSVSLY